MAPCAQLGRCLGEFRLLTAGLLSRKSGFSTVLSAIHDVRDDVLSFETHILHEMDFIKEEEEVKGIKRRFIFKRPSLTAIMVALSFCLIVLLCAFSFSSLGRASTVEDNAKATKTFSTKTPYKYEEYLSTEVSRPEGCLASQINMVFRHGTRYPSSNDIRKVDKMLKTLEGYSADVDFKKQLSRLGIQLVNPYEEKIEKELAVVGDRELYGIGLRFQKRFPELFDERFVCSDFRFTSTCKARSSQSASAFAMGFLEGHGTVGEAKYQPIPLVMKPCDNDTVLRFFDMCEKYEKNVAENDSTVMEMEKFLGGPEVAKVVEKVTSRLKLGGKKLTPEDVKMMYLLCAFGVAIDNKGFDEGWCSLFDLDDFDVMEYSLDLKSYYKRSSAYKITYQSSCPLLRAILQSMQAKAGRNVTFKKFTGVFRSSHAETLMPLYALMGLLVDKRHLMANNYEEMKNRQFRGAKIAPFAGNLAMVLYGCKNGKNKVQLYSNEKLIKLPCCQSKIDCPFEVFENCYKTVSDDCNLKSMCSVNNTLHRDEL